MKRTLILLNGVAVVVALAWAWQMGRMRADAQAAVLELRAPRAAQDADLYTVSTRIADAEKMSAELRKTRVPVSRAPVPPPVSAPAKSGAIPPPASTDAVTDKDPKLQVYELAAKRVSMETTYGPLLSRLQLTPAERERFLDVMLGRHEVTNDTANAVRSLGVKDSPAIQQLLQQQKDETSKAQLALLGEARFSELQQYERSRMVRAQVVDRLGGAMAATETPLTASQAEQLTQVLAAASSSYRSGGTATADSIDWDTAVADAKAVLAGRQLEAFASHAARQKTFCRVKQFIVAAKPVGP